MEKLQTLRENKDYINLAIECYNLGVEAMEAGKLDKATLWLSRSSTIYSAKDEIYEGVGDELQSDCSSRICDLEEEDSIYNSFISYTEEKLEELTDGQITVLGALSISRLVPLFNKLSKLEGCEVLGEIEQALNLILKSFNDGLTREEFDILSSLPTELYEFGDAVAYWGNTGVIELEGRPAFEVFDLNGMMGTVLELFNFILDYVDALVALSQGEEAKRSECGIVNCTLLPDYYARTTDTKLDDIPQIKAEIARINDDFNFVSSQLSIEDIYQRVNFYKALDILK